MTGLMHSCLWMKQMNMFVVQLLHKANVCLSHSTGIVSATTNIKFTNIADWTLCPSREPLSRSPFSHPISPSTWNLLPKVTYDQDESLLYNLCLK